MNATNYKWQTLICMCVLLVLMAPPINGFMKCECDRKKCKPPLNCPVGVTRDMCGCCDVCAKSEGELCAGLNHVEGVCGTNLQCIVRNIKDDRNRKVNKVTELVGRCEYKSCHYISCPFGQTCTLVNGFPKCSCPPCKEMRMSPVCGEKNNKQYQTECELRTEECLSGKSISLKLGKCLAPNSTRILCKEDGIRIELLKTFISDSNRRITLLDENCEFQRNQTHYFIDTKLTNCGTKVNFALSSIIYSNVIRTKLRLNNKVLRRWEALQIPVECFYPLRSRGTNRVKVVRRSRLGKKVRERLRRNGAGVRMRSDLDIYQKAQLENNNKIKVEIDHSEKYLVHLKVRSLNVTSEDGHLQPKYCYVTPFEKKYRWIRYSIIEEGCPVEDGVEIIDSKPPSVKMIVPGFNFQGSKYGGFLVRCKIRICAPHYEENNIDTCKVNCRKTNIRQRRSSKRIKELLLDLEFHGTPMLVSKNMNT